MIRFAVWTMQVLGYDTLGYMDLVESLRRISGKPTIDIPALYRQMVFNALIGNTNDHLKNFCVDRCSCYCGCFGDASLLT